jgi:general secretion pathway protein A
LVAITLGVGYLGLKQRHQHLTASHSGKRAAIEEQVKPTQRNTQLRPGEPQTPGVIQDGAYAHRVVEKGDTLAKLIMDVYGRVDPKMIRLVKKANYIENENLIIEGTSIVFPIIGRKNGR